MNPRPTNKLFEIADRQQGYFTAKQAVASGIDARHHHRYVARGLWSRELRSIYRLTQYPLPNRPDLILWYLWSRNRQDQPQAVYSYETALEIYDISDVMPPQLHMTLPKGYRKRSAIPPGLVIHHDSIPESDIWVEEGVPVTTPARTIIDLIRSQQFDDDIVMQAIHEGMQKGIIAGTRELLGHPLVSKNKKLRKEVQRLVGYYEEDIRLRRRL